MWTQPVPPALSDDVVAGLLPSAKAHLRVTTDDEDDLISAQIRTAIGHVEKMIGGFIIAREVTVLATAWSDLDRLPTAPVAEVSSIQYLPHGAADPEVLTEGGYRKRLVGLDPKVTVAPGQRWPVIASGSDISVSLVAGYTDDDRPPELWQAALLLIGQWFRNRSAVNVGNIVNELPNGVDALLCNHRRYLAG
jgi:uncharacterized phiE125 gp8 family phage protein